MLGKRRDNMYGNPKIVRGPLKGGFIVAMQRNTKNRPTRVRVVKPDGHRIKVNGWKSESVPTWMTRWMTDE